MLKEKLDTVVCEKLKIKIENKPSLTKWKKFLNKLYNPEQSIEIAFKIVASNKMEDCRSLQLQPI